MMSLELTAIPLAFLAGVVSILSPCVWPLVPVVMGSAATNSRLGPYALAMGLSVSFAVAGTLLTFVLVNTGTDPEFFRYIAAGLLVAAGILLVVKPLGEWVTNHLSALTSRFNVDADGDRWYGQFGVGLLLGLVWLPCVGPTLGAAIALASMGQQMFTAFIVMLVFGLGTASVLLLAGLFSGKLLQRWRPALLTNAGRGKLLLGWMLLILGLMVLTGTDKALQTWALMILPEWATSL
ncbi:MAG: cytochrome c biogenesis CcdA family protein [Pseudomonadales bacterium]|nr:cytochrome c biogenesis CcdA family protein [Pseudomonadales bacterium]